ncbi:hypothetical protein JD844_022821 [Phrynosoma platyrhinos]|uniref:Reverse transcriptase RNase H-like domain-containing protein n=1 Tax=Phrynosoma platyrhinos TaxID=52577 RepID=A0ABQ7SW43_PHRPL|nr:hypothetical protein JD844_022821 [Phrynosoma platyrhinos]
MASTTFVTAWAQLHFRPLQSWFLSVFDPVQDSPSRCLAVPRAVARSLRWWLDPANVCSGMPFSLPQPQLSLTTDALMEGWKAHVNDLMIHGHWNKNEKMLHMNELEMLAVLKALRAFEPVLRGKVVLLSTDNITVMYCLNKQGGTKSPPLLQASLQVWNWCLAHNIVLQAIHLPGQENELDQLSRSADSCHEWRLHPEAVARLFRLWGEPEVDAFATHLNSHCRRSYIHREELHM